ncbi:MAG: exo-alpha-sialidase [Planctomyces sp.]
MNLQRFAIPAFILGFVLSGISTVFAEDPSEASKSPFEISTVYEVDPDVTTKRGYRIPSIVAAKSGTLLAFSERRTGFRDHAENDIVLRRSHDEGQTWGALQVIADSGSDSLNDPIAVQLTTGRILLRWTHFPRGIHANNSKHTVIADPGYDGPKNVRIWLAHSDDDGATWSAPRDVTRMMRREQAVSLGSPGSGIQLMHGVHAGRILLPNYEVYHLGGGRRKTINSVSISDDGGETWSLSEQVPEPTPETQNFGDEAQIAELSDGSILMSARDEPKGGHRKLSVSRNGGQSWEPHRIAADLMTPPCMSSLIRYEWPQEKTAGLLLHTLPATPSSRSHGTIFVSRDEGRSWSRSITVTEGAFAYSCLIRLPNGDVGCLYEADEYRRIVFARIPAEQITRERP